MNHRESAILRQKLKNLQEHTKELEDEKAKRDEERARYESQVKLQHQAQLKETKKKLKVKHE